MLRIVPGGDTVSNTGAVWCTALSILLVGCSRDDKPTPPPAAGTQAEMVLAGAAVMIGAGDIAVCGSSGDERTARLVDSVLTADSAFKVISAVFTLGDNAYRSGSSNLSNYFTRCFAPSWGAPGIKKLIEDNGISQDEYKAFVDIVGTENADLALSIINEKLDDTERERQILRCLLDGNSNKHIARVLEITETASKEWPPSSKKF